MIQQTAFDPESGAPLSREKHFTPWHRVGVRIPVENSHAEWDDSREGALTNGELQSAGSGLLGYFRRVHRDVRPPDPALDRAAALALKRIKSDDDGKDAIDSMVWLTLAERLAEKGHWVAWMLDYFIPRCPHCHSELKFRAGAFSAEAICASSPTRHGAVDGDITDSVSRIYRSAFDTDDLLSFQFCRTDH